MKKTILLLAMMPFLSLSAVEPLLTKKDLSSSPAIPGTVINYAIGTRKMVSNTSFTPTGNYTVEVKAKLLSAAVKGLVLESRNASREGFRMAISSNGVENLGALNYTNETNPVSVNSNLNDATTYHTFRFAVEGTNVHIYRDGVYVTSTTTERVYNDNFLKESNGNFETADMSMWNFNAAPSGQGKTTTAGEFRTGTGAVKLMNANNSSVISTLTIKGLKPSTTYAFSFYTKFLAKSANNGNMRYDLKLGNYDGLGVFVKNNAVDNQNNIVGAPTNTTNVALSTWNYIGKQFTTGVADSVAIIDIIGWNGTNTYVIDDMSLNEVEVAPTIGATVGSNLVTNGDFATDATGWSAGGWPLGNVAYSATNGGQLQIQEVAWGGSWASTYSKSINVAPNKAYKLSAKTSHRVATTTDTRSIKLVDGASSALANYSVPAAVEPATNLTTYYDNTTPALVTSPTTTSISMQFTTKVGHLASATVAMTLDDVVVQEYEATFPSYLKYGKAYQSEASNIDIAYINYDLTGAYAPQNSPTPIANFSKKLIVSVANGKLIIKDVNAGDKVEVFNSLGMRIMSTLAKDGDNQFQLKTKGVMVVKVNNTLTKVIL